MSAWLYILSCTDGSYYTGTTRTDLDIRIAQHNAATFGGYTAERLPVKLVYSEHFEQIVDAIAVERQIRLVAREEGSADCGRFCASAKSCAPQVMS